MAGGDGDDFNRLYERLVVRRTSKKKRAKRVDTVATSDTKAQPEVEHEKNAETLKKISEAARLEIIKQKEQQEHNAKISRIVKRLRLARNLRGFARLTRRSPHKLAFQLVDATEQDEHRFLRKYQRVKRRRVVLVQRPTFAELERSMRLEGVAARLYRRRAAAFRPEAVATLEGRHRVVDELLFFSPPHSRFLSQIGYSKRCNVVPPPPSQLSSK